jgi:aquaporin Z
MVRKLVVEAIGTFFLLLTIGLVVIEPGAGQFAPLAIGGALMAMVYAGGHISGAHYNPAVSLAIYLRGLATIGQTIAYWGAQVAGALLAALAVAALKGEVAMAGVITAEPAIGEALLAEFLFTFALVHVILNVATARGTQGNSHYGLSIGIIVAAGAWAVGPVSGAAFNPAVAIGITTLGLSAFDSLWIFFVANFLGGASAALLFTVLDLGDDKPTESTPADQAALRPVAEPDRS